jgi:hypothetical protein
LHDFSEDDNFHISPPYDVENRSKDIADVKKRISIVKDQFPENKKEETAQTENL